MTKTEILMFLKEHKQELSEKFGLTKIGLFGSYARDEATEESDIDIVVELKRPNLLILSNLQQTLKELLHKSVDVIRLREKMNPYLKQQINKDAIYV